ncbi:hypothetical protein AWZ03_008749 [Drosophila navojoa]|uniref:Uncharacterized protein n=1 Tax=Drosophila navojoa TaxID=7232 RepID=A0A484B989_DRONA|nr:uncharacterized protein LOC108649570 [Drosophila navojoa]TDG44852.1 hypothetical protein AWZ03_008749 [Drosophila navojoa]
MDQSKEPELKDQSSEEEDGKELDYAQLTLYDVMRIENCKANRFLKKEAYPNIRPPISRCSNEKSGNFLSEAIVDMGCRVPFGKDKRFDTIEIWRQAPNKDSLSFYGMGSKVNLPEAVEYRRALTNSLNLVNGIDPKAKKSKKPKKPEKLPKPKGAYVLNRNILHCAINKMPTVLKKTHAKNSHRILYCPEDEYEDDFGDYEPYIPLQVALDMEKPPKKPRHGLRRNHQYCDVQCGLPDNMCTYYQWMKYKEDTLPYDVEFDLETELEEAMAEEQDDEPRNFDELYSNLVSCFEKNKDEIPPCTIYGKCCRRPSERVVIQGCGEDKIFGPHECECNCADS